MIRYVPGHGGVAACQRSDVGGDASSVDRVEVGARGEARAEPAQVVDAEQVHRRGVREDRDLVDGDDDGGRQVP
jgi:hypothetical protein